MHGRGDIRGGRTHKVPRRGLCTGGRGGVILL